MNLPASLAFNFNIKENAEASRIFTLGVPIVAIAISFLVIGFVIWPKINEIVDLRNNNKLLVARADSLENKANILASVDKSKLEQQLVASEQLLPSDKNVFSVLRQIEQAASQTGVLLNKVEAVTGTINEPSTTPPGTGAPVSAPIAVPAANNTSNIAPKVEVRLSITSDYTSLIKFLSSLYTFSRVVSVDAISLSAAFGESLQLRTTFTVDAYWKSLPEALGSIENPVEKLTSAEEQLLDKVSKPEAIQAPTVPTVPVGRSDLFTPF